MHTIRKKGRDVYVLSDQSKDLGENIVAVGKTKKEKKGFSASVLLCFCTIFAKNKKTVNISTTNNQRLLWAI